MRMPQGIVTCSPVSARCPRNRKITEGVGEDKDILALYQDETEAVYRCLSSGMAS